MVVWVGFLVGMLPASSMTMGVAMSKVKFSKTTQARLQWFVAGIMLHVVMNDLKEELQDSWEKDDKFKLRMCLSAFGFAFAVVILYALRLLEPEEMHASDMSQDLREGNFEMQEHKPNDGLAVINQNVQDTTSNIVVPRLKKHGSKELFMERKKSIANVASEAPWSIIGAVAINALVDGINLGIQSAEGFNTGIKPAIGTSVEMFFLGVTCSGLVFPRVTKPLRVLCLIPPVVLVTTCVFVNIVAAAAGDHVVFSGILAFAFGSLLFMILNELIPEALSAPRGGEFSVSVMVFVGFVGMEILESILPSEQEVGA